MRRLRDFRCGSDHVTEHLVEDGCKSVACPECGATALRIISPVRCRLDHSFPGESLKWAKKHEEEAKRKTEPTDKVDLR